MTSLFRDESSRLPSAALEPSQTLPAPVSVRASGLVVVIDDDSEGASALERVLRADGHRVASLADAAGLDPWLSDPSLDVVVIDLGQKGGANAAADILVRVKQARPDVSSVVMTDRASIESAVACMRRGAFDYLVKPFEDAQRVRTTVCKAVQQRRQAAAQLKSAPRADFDDRLPLTLDAYEKRVLERSLNSSGGDATAAARKLGIGRSTFYRKLAKHGIRSRGTTATPAIGVGAHGSIR